MHRVAEEVQSQVSNPLLHIADALGVLGDYAYRKEFGLSYSDFIKEPVDEYLRNKEIMGIMSDIQRATQKRMERESKK